MTEKIHILRNWRKNKSIPVKDPYTPIKFFDTEPEILRNREVKATTTEETTDLLPSYHIYRFITQSPRPYIPDGNIRPTSEFLWSPMQASNLIVIHPILSSKPSRDRGAWLCSVLCRLRLFSSLFMFFLLFSFRFEWNLFSRDWTTDILSLFFSSFSIFLSNSSKKLEYELVLCTLRQYL